VDRALRDYRLSRGTEGGREARLKEESRDRTPAGSAADCGSEAGGAGYARSSQHDLGSEPKKILRSKGKFSSRCTITNPTKWICQNRPQFFCQTGEALTSARRYRFTWLNARHPGCLPDAGLLAQRFLAKTAQSAFLCEYL
jgi:hypothetical protein